MSQPAHTRRDYEAEIVVEHHLGALLVSSMIEESRKGKMKASIAEKVKIPELPTEKDTSRRSGIR